MSDNVTLVSDDTVVPVKNMMNHRVAYVLDSGVRRRFAPYATFNITAGELRQLSYQPGGTELLTNYLHVGNKNLAREFGVSDNTIEYDWTEQDIVNALTTDDIDVLLDALDFAPDGIKESIVEKAVELEIPDINRRKAIKDATGSDITKMIEVKHAYDSAEEDDTKQAKTAATRRTSSKTASSAAKKTQTKTATRRTTKTEG